MAGAAEKQLRFEIAQEEVLHCTRSVQGGNEAAPDRFNLLGQSDANSKVDAEKQS